MPSAEKVAKLFEAAYPGIKVEVHRTGSQRILQRVMQELQANNCTGLAGVPSTYQILLRKTRFKSSRFPSLRWLQQAGGRLPTPCIQEAIDAFPHVRFYVMYGQTEGTARLSYLPPERLHDKLGSIGRGLPSTSLEVLTPRGTPVPAGSGDVGEIVATGDAGPEDG